MSVMPFPALGHSGGVLIASPSTLLREQLLHRLNGRCRPVQQAMGGADALAKLESGDWQVLFLDRRLPDLNAEEVIAISRQRFPGIRVVMVDSEQSLSTNFLAPHERNRGSENRGSENRGSEEDPAEVEERPGRRQEISAAPVELGNLPPSPPPGVEPLPGMIGSSDAMQRVYRMVRLVAPRTTTVLIAGATGTGKELVSSAVHQLSPRASRPLIVVNCAAIPETLLESELFGYARGAFTGAVQSQLGRIPAAHGGTLFLDEVSELPLGVQAKLLRFLEQKEIQRLGTCETTRVDVRVVAASNVDLECRAARGEFRQDLFYRLSAFPIELPPLVERPSDIVPLAQHFLACMAAAMQTHPPRLSAEAVRLLEGHPWKGNVRELQYVMERASILAENSDIVEADHLYFSYRRNFVRTGSRPAAMTTHCS
jgi:DNA-binding NtrC family response regulator